MEQKTKFEQITLPSGLTVTQVTATCTIRVNAGNYEHGEYSHFMNATIDTAVIDPLEAASALMMVCKKAVIIAAAPLITKRANDIKSAFEKLPQQLQDQVNSF